MEVTQVKAGYNTHVHTDPYLYEGTFIYAGTLNPDGSYTKTGYPLTDVHGV